MKCNKLHENLIVHDTLNSDLFSLATSKLKPEICQKLTLIAEYFIAQYLPEDTQILDIRLVGSTASYNYTNYSDIDLHIIVNFEQFNCSSTLLQTMFNYEKSAFNSSFDIQVKQHPVEIYIEDVNTTVISNGIYSVKTDEWIKYPAKIESPLYDTSSTVNELSLNIQHVIDKGSIDDVEKTINALYMMRKNGIDTEGEYGFSNQVFKDIRNLGLLQELKDKYKQLKSTELSLEQLDMGDLY